MIYPKSRDITLPTKVCIVKAMVFPVVMYGCENWVIKKAECQRTDAFELWCWRRLSRVPWTARRSNQLNPKGDLSWIFIGRTAAEAELQSFGHLMGRANSLEKTLLLWKTEGRRRRGDGGWDGWMASLTQWMWVWASSGRCGKTEKPVCCCLWDTAEQLTDNYPLWTLRQWTLECSYHFRILISILLNKYPEVGFQEKVSENILRTYISQRTCIHTVQMTL